MFTETLSGNTEKSLALLGESHLLDQAYLAGGTACALQLGHRISVDLDFFTRQTFDARAFIQSLQEIGEFELKNESWGTVQGTLLGVSFSLFVYDYPVLFPTTPFRGVHLLDLRDIAAMKIDAIGSRGIMRDFMDLYFICRSGLSLREILAFYDRKYGKLSSNRIHIEKSLVYFVDAEATVVPRMLKPVEWSLVKRFFEQEVKRLMSLE